MTSNNLFDHDAEMGLVGGLLMHGGEHFEDVAPLTPSDFSDGRVRGVFAAFLSLYQSGQPVTVPDVPTPTPPLLLPRCVGCGAPGPAICPACQRFHDHAVEVEQRRSSSPTGRTA